MIFIYRLLYLPGLLIGLPYYAYRMWRRGGYRTGFSNRFGLMRKLPRKCKNVKRIWIQAVSVGELLAIRPMLRELKRDSTIEIFLTTTTSTGLRVLKQNLLDLVAWHGVFPLDFWPFSKMAWNRINPDLVILMEGELWPEHIHQARIRRVPSILVNARLSDRSFKRHFKFRKFARLYFQHLSEILASSDIDRNRLVKLNWLSKEKIHLTGNLKLDVRIPDPPSIADRKAFFEELGMPQETVLFLGSSTWDSEESALVDIYKSLRDKFPEMRLLIVPRHAERKLQLQSMISEKDVAYHFRSDSRQAPANTEVYIADTTGELGALTNFADIVFVGKSMPPNTGGQTPVEAAAMGKPLLFGPEMSNFKQITRDLLNAGGAKTIQSQEELYQAVADLLGDSQKRQQMGTAAAAVIESSRGATNRVIQHIKANLIQES